MVRYCVVLILTKVDVDMLPCRYQDEAVMPFLPAAEFLLGYLNRVIVPSHANNI